MRPQASCTGHGDTASGQHVCAQLSRSCHPPGRGEHTSALSTCALSLQECWRRNPQERPSFEQLKGRMETIWQAAQQDESLRRGQTGLLSKFRKSKG